MILSCVCRFNSKTTPLKTNCQYYGWVLKLTYDSEILSFALQLMLYIVMIFVSFIWNLRLYSFEFEVTVLNVKYEVWFWSTESFECYENCKSYVTF